MALQDLTPQLRTRLRRVEKIVGLFVGLATLVLLGGFIYYIYHRAERKGWFTPKCPYYTFVMSGEGLNVGDQVMLMGFSVGEISVIEAQPPDSYYKVFVGFQVKRPYYGYIWTDSKVKIAASDFLGRRQIEISTGYDGQPTVYEKNGRITEILDDKKRVALTPKSKGVFLQPNEEPALTARAEKLVTQIELALPNILNLTNQLSAVLTSTTRLTSNANSLVTQVQPVVTNLTVITASLRDPHGSLGEWLIPTNINTRLTATLGSANSTVTNANAQITLLATSLDSTLLNLASITSNLNAQVEANDQMLTEISSLVRQADDLVQGLKKHWLLRGSFQKKPGQTNAPPAKTNVQPKIEEKK